MRGFTRVGVAVRHPIINLFDHMGMVLYNESFFFLPYWLCTLSDVLKGILTPITFFRLGFSTYNILGSTSCKNCIILTSLALVQPPKVPDSPHPIFLHLHRHFSVICPRNTTTLTRYRTDIVMGLGFSLRHD